MSRPVLAALLLLWSPAFAFAQEGDATPPATQQEPDAAYQSLVKSFNKAIADWQQEASKQAAEAQKNGKPLPPITRTPPTKEFIERAEALAKKHAGEDAAVQYLSFVCKYASSEKESVQMAVKTLTLDHAGSTAIGDVLPHLGNAANQFDAKDAVMELFGEVIESNPLPDCKAQAMIARGAMRLEMAQSDEDRAAARADLEGVAKVTKDDALLAQAKDALFEILHLQVGCEAPDIVAKDVDGVTFKLSDYRGKVVLLDFWGFW